VHEILGKFAEDHGLTTLRLVEVACEAVLLTYTKYQQILRRPLGRSHHKLWSPSWNGIAKCPGGFLRVSLLAYTTNGIGIEAGGF